MVGRLGILWGPGTRDPVGGGGHWYRVEERYGYGRLKVLGVGCWVLGIGSGAEVAALTPITPNPYNS